jgi:hypothetical protein
MAKERVELDPEQWNQITQILATAPIPWQVSNPLLVALSAQLQALRAAQQGGHLNGAFSAERSATGETAAGSNPGAPIQTPGSPSGEQGR